MPYLLDMAWLPPLGSYWYLLRHKNSNNTSSQPVSQSAVPFPHITLKPCKADSATATHSIGFSCPTQLLTRCRLPWRLRRPLTHTNNALLRLLSNHHLSAACP
jgi:hypothetical protein